MDSHETRHVGLRSSELRSPLTCGGVERDVGRGEALGGDAAVRAEHDAQQVLLRRQHRRRRRAAVSARNEGACVRVCVCVQLGCRLGQPQPQSHCDPL